MSLELKILHYFCYFKYAQSTIYPFHVSWTCRVIQMVTIILQSESVSLLLLSEYLVGVKLSGIVHAQLINTAEDVPLFTQMSFTPVLKLSRINIQNKNTYSQDTFSIVVL